MTVDTPPPVWPWPADTSPVRPPEGVRTSVAALAVPSPHLVQAHITRHLAPMTAASLAALGLPCQQTSGLIPPLRWHDRDGGIALLAGLRSELVTDGTDLREVAGWSLRTAHEALLAWEPAARPLLAVMSISVVARARAAKLS